KYVYSDDELEKIRKEFATSKVNKEETKKQKKTKPEKDETLVVEETDASVEAIPTGGLGVQRYKGLGEMNPQQLWETTMDPVRRMMKQVTIDDAAKADETFDILMGADVAPRKRFIHTHAKSVKNLDI
ncbi:MAG: gyrase subunit B protein, partial [Parcubacteria group bacterium GW2011_GWE2_43_12]